MRELLVGAAAGFACGLMGARVCAVCMAAGRTVRACVGGWVEGAGVAVVVLSEGITHVDGQARTACSCRNCFK